MRWSRCARASFENRDRRYVLGQENAVQRRRARSATAGPRFCPCRQRCVPNVRFSFDGPTHQPDYAWLYPDKIELERRRPRSLFETEGCFERCRQFGWGIEPSLFAPTPPARGKTEGRWAPRNAQVLLIPPDYEIGVSSRVLGFSGDHNAPQRVDCDRLAPVILAAGGASESMDPVFAEVRIEVAVVGGCLADFGRSPTRRDGAGPLPGNGHVGNGRQTPIVPLGAELRTGGAVSAAAALDSPADALRCGKKVLTR